jgi:chromosome segregation ATPase
MNEKFKKNVVVFSFLFLIGCIVVQSIVDNNAIRRADNAVDTLGEQLADAQARLVGYTTEIRESRATIDECRSSVRRVTDGLDRQSTELKDIIENLKTVRAEVENMENALNLFYDKYGDNDSNDSDTVKEIK